MESEAYRYGSGSLDVRQKLEPLFNQAKCELILCGHTHMFFKVSPNQRQNSYPIIASAEDTTTRVDVSENNIRPTITRKDGKVLDILTVKPN